MPLTSSQRKRSCSSSGAPRNDARFCVSTDKRVQTLTKAELASLFGVPTYQLGQLGRHGIFRRLGVDRYLLDPEQPALFLRRQERALLAGALRRGQRAVVPAATLRGVGPEPAAQAIYKRVAEFYRGHEGLLESGVNILNVPDVSYATLAAGAFLSEGIQRNERVAVLSFEHPAKLFSRLAEAGLVLDWALQAEQMIYLYYKPDVAHSISLSVDYRELFNEVVRIGGEGIQRLVLFNVDALINANSEHLVHTSLHQLIYAANHFQLTLLGLFVASGHVAELLDEGCRAILPGYYLLD